ncbi:MAG: transposase, partial [Desulfobacterales bacterium]
MKEIIFQNRLVLMAISTFLAVKNRLYGLWEKKTLARAKRHYIAGKVWHITHRCHKREFLLKFAKDRRRWLQWLFEAKKRYGLKILNYAVTSNHIHLLVVDDSQRETIPRSL